MERYQRRNYPVTTQHRGHGLMAHIIWHAALMQLCNMLFNQLFSVCLELNIELHLMKALSVAASFQSKHIRGQTTFKLVFTFRYSLFLQISAHACVMGVEANLNTVCHLFRTRFTLSFHRMHQINALLVRDDKSLKYIFAYVYTRPPFGSIIIN